MKKLVMLTLVLCSFGAFAGAGQSTDEEGRKIYRVFTQPKEIAIAMSLLLQNEKDGEVQRTGTIYDYTALVLSGFKIKKITLRDAFKHNPNSNEPRYCTAVLEFNMPGVSSPASENLTFIRFTGKVGPNYRTYLSAYCE